MTAWEVLRDAPRRWGVPRPTRPRLTSIPLPERRLSTAPFAALMVAFFVAGVVGLLLLITEVQTTSFAVREEQRKAAELGYALSDLEARVYRAQSPEELARRATGLGMVPNPHGVFVDLSTGRIVGEATPVRGDEMPGLLVRAPAEAEAVGEQPAAAPEQGPPAPEASDTTGASAPEATAPAEGTGTGESAP